MLKSVVYSFTQKSLLLLIVDYFVLLFKIEHVKHSKNFILCKYDVSVKFSV